MPASWEPQPLDPRSVPAAGTWHVPASKSAAWVSVPSLSRVSCHRLGLVGCSLPAEPSSPPPSLLDRAVQTESGGAQPSALQRQRLS